MCKWPIRWPAPRQWHTGTPICDQTSRYCRRRRKEVIHHAPRGEAIPMQHQLRPQIIVPWIIHTVHYLKSLATPETTRLSGQVKLSVPPKELMNPLHSYSPCARAASNNSMDAPNMKRTAIIPPSSCSGPIDIVESLAARSPLHAVQIRSCMQKK